MAMTWQAWCWIALFALVGAVTGYYTHWFLGLIAFIVPILVFAMWMMAAMNTDI